MPGVIIWFDNIFSLASQLLARATDYPLLGKLYVYMILQIIHHR